jgi:hypothetical protein
MAVKPTPPSSSDLKTAFGQFVTAFNSYPTATTPGLSDLVAPGAVLLHIYHDVFETDALNYLTVGSRASPARLPGPIIGANPSIATQGWTVYGSGNWTDTANGHQDVPVHFAFSYTASSDGSLWIVTMCARVQTPVARTTPTQIINIYNR